MPRFVRNFWLRLRVDGRATPIETGPATVEGGFDLTILMREEGAISEKRVRVYGDVTRDGTLILHAYVDGGGPGKSLTVTTRR